MVATTTNYGLPYPAGPDRPCDSWKTWGLLATALDDKLTSLDATLDRTARTRPMAKVSTSKPQQMYPASTLGDYVVFDTVQVDTDGWVDLSSNPKFIVPQRQGLYHVVATVNYDNLDVGAYGYAYIGYGSGGGFDKDVTQYEFAWAYDSGAFIESDTYADSSTAIGLRVNSTGVTGDDPRVTSAEMTVFWIGEYV